MRIILDTNILRQDFFIRSRRFELLVDFITKTTHSIVLPQVIFDEIISLYKRELSNSYQIYKRGKNDLFGKLLSTHKRKDLKLNIDKEIDLFVKNLKKKLHIHKGSVIPHNNDHLPELVDRAINKRPPFIKSDKEFRDGLIWLSLFDIAKKFKTKSIVLISNNTKDFCDKNKKLHPELEKESKLKGIELSFFPSLEDFLKEHASKIEFITKEWILKSIDIKDLTIDIESYIDFYKEKEIADIIEENVEDFEEVTTVTVLDPEIEDFYVYEMADGSLRIEATFESELEVEYESAGEYDFHYPISETEVHIIVEGKKVQEVEVTDSYIY